MNAIEKFRSDIQSQFPGCRTEMSLPYNEDGLWILHVSFGEREVQVQWKPVQGWFGVSMVMVGKAFTLILETKADSIFDRGKDREALAEVRRLLTTNVIEIRAFR